MAKPPKAPGANGPGTAATVFDELTSRVEALSGSSHWCSTVLAVTAGAVAELLGEAAARSLLPMTLHATHAETRAKGLLAAGLARRGEAGAAAAARAEAVADIGRHDVDGEAGTVAWCAVARASAALGDQDGVARALDEAEACAERDRINPTQPWSHWMLALAEHGRLDRLAAALAARPTFDIAFDIEKAATRGVALATAAGDLAAIGRFREALRGAHPHVLYAGALRGGEDAIRAGRGATLHETLKWLADTGHAAAAAARLALVAAEVGDAALARALLGRVAGVEERGSNDVANAYEVLGDGAAAAAERARIAGGELRPFAFDELARPLRVWRARDAAGAQALAAAQEALARTLPGRDGWEALADVGLARVAAGDAAGAALVDEAVAGADALPKTDQGWTRNFALQKIGNSAADGDAWAPSFAALRKCTSKHYKPQVASRLASLYARAGDPAGVRAVLAHVPATELKGLMAGSDALHVLAGREPPWVEHS
ncbi:MAG: hypothetical protein U0324_23780 [Polyangiales bacterium]